MPARMWLAGCSDQILCRISHGGAEATAFPAGAAPGLAAWWRGAARRGAGAERGKSGRSSRKPSPQRCASRGWLRRGAEVAVLRRKPPAAQVGASGRDEPGRPRVTPAFPPGRQRLPLRCRLAGRRARTAAWAVQA